LHTVDRPADWTAGAVLRLLSRCTVRRACLPRAAHSLRGGSLSQPGHSHGHTPAFAAPVALEMGTGHAGLDPPPHLWRWADAGRPACSAVVARCAGERAGGL